MRKLLITGGAGFIGSNFVNRAILSPTAFIQTNGVVETICALLDELAPKPGFQHASLITLVKDRPGHDRRYAIDCTKIQRELGWTPKESVESGLRKTVQWYLNNSEWVDQVQSGAYRNWIEENYADRVA